MEAATDSFIWDFACLNDAVIVTKDYIRQHSFEPCKQFMSPRVWQPDPNYDRACRRQHLALREVLPFTQHGRRPRLGMPIVGRGQSDG
jgi:hypothetical protein